ncbi:MAG: PEGA domain-containing protein [Phycisphaera sp.]|nr:PEGA domain-containing protein [Phycisphaera sp.]
MLTRVRTIVGVVLVGALISGCVERTITVTSEPSGALTYINDQEVGRTPVTVPFRFYGTYDVRLEKDGYTTLWTQAKARAPVWEYPGPDLLAEAVPGAKSNIAWHFDLQPRPATQEDLLIDHAQQLRATLPGSTPSNEEPQH